MRYEYEYYDNMNMPVYFFLHELQIESMCPVTKMSTECLKIDALQSLLLKSLKIFCDSLIVCPLGHVQCSM